MQVLGVFLSVVVGVCVAFKTQTEEDIGPDTCGQDRLTLGTWFLTHGSPSLLLDPIPPVVSEVVDDPYADESNPPLSPDEVTGFCGMQWSDQLSPDGLRHYRLQNFSSEAEVSAANFTVTHSGHCGACSSLQDLGVYMSGNLTTPTRLCGVLGIASAALERRCLKDLGFSDMCASIWEFNIHNTRSDCFAVCLWSWITNEPFNKPDGSLNDCLQCDEDMSGPNFKYFSGRTRRNSGIPSSIYRPPETVFNMTHCYWYGELEAIE